jgi:predicted dehydrogenase
MQSFTAGVDSSLQASAPTFSFSDSSLLIIGTGSIGYRHLMNAHALGVRTLSVYRTGAGEPRGPLPEVIEVETDLATALRKCPKAVIVANPSAKHIETALAAVRANAHILVEKPLSNRVDGVENLIAEINARKLVATVGYQFRFHPALRQVRLWLQQQEIGEIVHAHANWGEYLPSWQPWRDYRTSYAGRADLGGGVTLTLSHPIDYLRWLLGEVVMVTALTSRRSGLEIDVEDTCLIQMEFETGIVASVSLDYVQKPGQHNLTIVGRGGVIKVDFNCATAILDCESRSIRFDPAADFDRNHMFRDELAHFLSCIDGHAEPICSLEDGAATLRVCLAALESARTGKRLHVG